jgi:hypothetical protein
MFGATVKCATVHPFFLTRFYFNFQFKTVRFNSISKWFKAVTF